MQAEWMKNRSRKSHTDEKWRILIVAVFMIAVVISINVYLFHVNPGKLRLNYWQIRYCEGVRGY